MNSQNASHLPVKRTMTVPEAGLVLGLGRGPAYEAARRGDLPTIRIGRRLLVPVAALARMLGEEPEPVKEGVERADGRAA